MTYDAQERSAHGGSKVELYLFETEDGIHSWAYTTDQKPITALGKTFSPATIKRTELKQSAGQSSTERLTITVPFDNPVAVLHVPYLPPRPIKVTVYSYQRRDLSLEIKQGFVGYVAAFSQKGEDAELSCSQIIDAFNQIVPPWVYKANCIYATYEEGCDLDPALWRINATVSAVDDPNSKVTSPDFATKPDDWFRGGFAVVPSTGETRFVVAHTGNTVTLKHPFTDLQPDTVIQIYAGDDHTEQTCRTKFNNKANYLAFDHTPTFNVFDKGTK